MSYMQREKKAGNIIFFTGIILIIIAVILGIFDRSTSSALEDARAEVESLDDRYDRIEWKIENMTNVCGQAVGTNTFYPDSGNDFSDYE